MSGNMSRNKGQRGEREFIRILQSVIDEVFGEGTYELKRNLFQTRDGGDDVAGLPKEFDIISVEVKFQETLNTHKWWQQATDQAGDREPVLAFRQKHKKWRIIKWGSLMGIGDNIDNEMICEVEVSLDNFLKWYKKCLERCL